MSASKKTTRKNKPVNKTSKRRYVQSPVVHDPGVSCPHCGESYGHTKAHKYPNGRQRMICGGCGMPFMVWRKIAKS